jgi:hypothetical protein
LLKDVLDGNDWAFSGISYEPIIEEDGREHVTFGGQSIVGIKYHCGINWDSCVKLFSDYKVMKWLYLHGYDVGEAIDFGRMFEERDELEVAVKRKDQLIKDLYQTIKKCGEKYPRYEKFVEKCVEEIKV